MVENMIYVYDIYIYIKKTKIQKKIGIQMVFQENLATTATTTTKTIPAINNNQQSKKWNE